MASFDETRIIVQGTYLNLNEKLLCYQKRTTRFVVDPISEDTPLGKQLQYFRRLNKNMTVEEMAEDVNIGYRSIERIEQNLTWHTIITKGRFRDLKKLIKYLDAEDKLCYKKGYVEFILRRQVQIISKLVNEFGPTEIGRKLKVNRNTVSRWKSGKNVINIANYNKLIKIFNIN